MSLDRSSLFYRYIRTYFAFILHSLCSPVICAILSYAGFLSAISYVIVNPVNGSNGTARSVWRYIYSLDDVLYYSNMSIIDPWERYVHCLFCNSMATLKPTKTRRIMLRCNTCGALVFANGIFSQQRIKTLRDFRFASVDGLV